MSIYEVVVREVPFHLECGPEGFDRVIAYREGLFAIFDGSGCAPASRLASETLQAGFFDPALVRSLTDLGSLRNHLRSVMEPLQPIRDALTTVLVALASETTVQGLWIGDSRLYVVEREGVFRQVTTDRPGGKYTDERCHEFVVHAWEELLLLSDGVTNYCEAEDLKAVMLASATLDEKAARILKISRETQDDRSVILVRR